MDIQIEQIKERISAAQISQRVEELGHQIAKDYENKNLVVICVLKGGVVFFSDLIRYLKRPLECEFIRISSYGNAMTSSGTVTVTKDVEIDLNGKDVLLIEDIVDTGTSILFLRKHFQQRYPKLNSLKVCTLLLRQTSPEPVEYSGFVIDDGFVIGYGLDCAEKFRELPFIGEVSL
jgi:hypoxanthine phosphoribosyltransferase